jgi:DNA-damage-inducible protein J
MAKSTAISARINPELKQNVEQIFHELGLSASQAITLFYRQVELQQGLPFEVKLPNPTTVDALRQAETRDKLQSFENTSELFEDLGIA